MPIFRTKKEAFIWLSSGEKTIDVRKGKPRHGEIANVLCGRKVLQLRILSKETGLLTEVINQNNFRLVIPSAPCLNDAFAYLEKLYECRDGIFTAYYLGPLE